MAATPAHRPPMGWNSWDCYGTTVTEAEVVANAQFMAAHLREFGWDTVVIDIDWSDPSARSHGYNFGAPLEIDDYGRLVPDPVRFPSSSGGRGFGPIADRIHALGLKFGIHVMRGVPRIAAERALPVLGTAATAAEIADRANVCEWNPDMFGLDHGNPAAQAYYDSTLALYAQWGVDFIKADDMLWPYQAVDIEAYDRAIAASGREIALSLSPGRDLSLARLHHLREHATMWRICDDLWDNWADVEANFARFARWAPFAGAHGWPDGDMLPLGRLGIRAERGEPRDDGLLPAERQTLMTLWAIARSPLMIGGDLPSSAPDVVALFTNADVYAMHATATSSRELFREWGLVLWGADGPDGTQWVAAFNLDDTALAVTLDAQNLGLPVSAGGDLGGRLIELWTGRQVAGRRVTVQSDDARGVAPGSVAVDLELPAHGAALLRFDPLR
jgi:hypothetical protein